MLKTKTLKTEGDFKSLKHGDTIACEFHRNVHDYPKKPFRFKVFQIVENKESHQEIILQKKNNIYFNYAMFLDGDSNLKSAMLIEQINED